MICCSELSLTLLHRYANSSQARVVPSTSYVPSRQKRSYEEDDDMDTQPQKQREAHAGMSVQNRHSFDKVKFTVGQNKSVSIRSNL